MIKVRRNPDNPNYIRGNKALADILGVHTQTVQKYRRDGILDPATVVNYQRVIIYDLKKVFECLHHNKVKSGRPRIAN